MKSFTEYLAHTKPRYEFVVRIAECDLKDRESAIRNGLAAYVVEEITKPRRLPIQEHSEFVGMGPCEVHVVEVRLQYPVISDQVRESVARALGISASQVVARTKNEDHMRTQTVPEPSKAKDGSVLTNPNLESESGQPLAGQKRLDSLLKELETRKYEFAAKESNAVTSDLPMGDVSPVGSNQNKIPSPRKGK